MPLHLTARNTKCTSKCLQGLFKVPAFLKNAESFIHFYRNKVLFFCFSNIFRMNHGAPPYNKLPETTTNNTTIISHLSANSLMI